MRPPFSLFATVMFLRVWVDTGATATGADFTLLSAELGSVGGSAASARFTADTETGAAIDGGVSSITTGGVVAKLGYAGQLYDVTSLALSASPGSSINEGDAARLFATLTMDDETSVNTSAVIWSVLDGPVTVGVGGLAIAGAVTENGTALVTGSRDGVSGSLGLTILNLPYRSNPLTWTDPVPGGNGPYRVLLGTADDQLVEVGQPTVNHFNPGQLAMGTTYYYRVFDANGTDITPGGNGTDPVSFTTRLFQPDLRIGTKSTPATQQGNNVYNPSGAAQSASLTVKGRRPGLLHFTVENDGDDIDGHLVRATQGSRKLGSVNYYRATGGRFNVTGAATRAGYLQSELSPGGSTAYQIQIRATGKKKASQTLRIGASSPSDFRGIDTALGKLRAEPVKKR